MTAAMPIRAAPYAHQQAAFEFAMTQNATAFLCEMGVGKTLVSVAVVGALSLSGRVRRTLSVAPLSVVGVWDAEFAKFADFPYTLTVLTGTLAQKAETLQKLNGTNLPIAVINYESAWRLEKELAEWKPDLVIADEAHKLKSHTTAASKAMHRLGAKAAYRLALTGTLVTNKALDVFSPYKFLNPTIFGTNFYAFRNRYFNAYGYGGYQYRLKPAMEAELTRKIHSIAYVATKADCLDLPPTTDIMRYVDLERSAAKLYRELVREGYAKLERGEISVTNVLTKTLHKTSHRQLHYLV